MKSFRLICDICGIDYIHWTFMSDFCQQCWEQKMGKAVREYDLL